MKLNKEQIQLLNQIKTLQQELESEGLRETSEILKLAIISLYAQMGGSLALEDSTL